jgi:energy-coupling factor transporter ATP-binding protein EcfA2
MIITTEVFTPTTQARLTFVDRNVDELNENLVDSLRTPGTQIVIYGHSGTGKSTLLFNVLNRIYERTIVSRCTSDTTYDQLILNAFDNLNPFYTSQISEKLSQTISASLNGEYIILKASINAAIASETVTTAQRIIPQQLTAQRLAEFMGAAKCCWIIEDFHKIKDSEKSKLSQQLKVFVDTSLNYPDVKTILVGAVNSAREVIEYDSEMNNRVVELFVPLMTDNELHQILDKGENILNIRFTQKTKNEIVKFSSGLASITHRIALIMCQGKNINNKQVVPHKFSDDDLLKAIKKYISGSSDTLRKRYEKAVKVHKVRKYDNGKVIIEALANMKFEEVQQNAILNEIRKIHPNYPQANLSTYLTQLQSTEKGEIIIINPNNGKYSFSDPLIRTYIKCRNDIEKQGAVDPNIKQRLIKEAMEFLFNGILK